MRWGGAVSFVVASALLLAACEGDTTHYTKGMVVTEGCDPSSPRSLIVDGVARPPGSRPVEGALVAMLLSHEPTARAYEAARTAPDGTFSPLAFETPATDVSLRVTHPDYKTAHIVYAPADLARTDTRTFVVTLSPSDCGITPTPGPPR
ncbi:MAG: hypothetical protein FJ318_08130 [SAR202 cluster bacterium]|nr:hypothetical protein [SAR202 cluster bacterium]